MVAKREMGFRSVACVELLEGRTMLSLPTLLELPGAPGVPGQVVQMGKYYYYGDAEGLHRTDGTPEGTVLVRELVDDPNVESIPLIVMDNVLYFPSLDEEHGNEFWRSDGTPQGTWIVKDIMPGKDLAVEWDLALGSNPREFVVDNHRLYFTVERPSGPVSKEEIWVSDGTEEGTHRVKDISDDTYIGEEFIDDLTVVDGLAFFVHRMDFHRRKLWATDGTEEGTIAFSGDGWARDFISYNGTVLYVGGNGNDLRWADVRTARTGPAVSIGGDEDYGRIGEGDIKELDGRLFMLRNGGNREHPYSSALWTSDATDAGTVPIKSFAVNTRAHHLTRTGNYLSFFVTHPHYGGGTAAPALDDSELWVSDGTEAGTVLVSTLPDMHIESVVSGSGILYFVAVYRGRESQLWRSDGTVEGTYAVSSVPLEWSTGGLPMAAMSRDGRVARAAASRGTAKYELRMFKRAAFVDVTDPYGERHLYAARGLALARPLEIDGTKRADKISVVKKHGWITVTVNGKERTIKRTAFSTINIDGGAGDDRIYVGKGMSFVSVNGGEGNDVVVGSDGGSTLAGGDGDDLLVGGEGTDSISGDGGDDVLLGGGGEDSFRSQGDRNSGYRKPLPWLAVLGKKGKLFELPRNMTPRRLFEEKIKPKLKRKG